MGCVLRREFHVPFFGSQERAIEKEQVWLVLFSLLPDL
jgi:hypothetical protein